MKQTILALPLTISIIGYSVANDTFVIDTNALKQMTAESVNAQNIDYFTLFDIDSNGKLSPTECAGSFEGIEAIPYFNKNELLELKKNIDNSFSDFDKDKDGYLDKTEAQEYFSFIENVGISSQTKKIDSNDDGLITEDEMNQYMKNMPSLEESMNRLHELTQKLKNINDNPQPYINNMFSNITNNISNEEYIQMDKNKNNQVTQQEYIDYMYNHPNNKEFGFTKEDYENMYQLIDTTKKGYITYQEYIDFQQKQLNDILSDNYK